jgi:hypothetical protein
MTEDNENFKEGDQVKITLYQGGFQKGDICTLIELTENNEIGSNQWKIAKDGKCFRQNEFAMEKIKP